MGEQMELVDDRGRVVPLHSLDDVRVVMTFRISAPTLETECTVRLIDEASDECIEHATFPVSHGPSGWLSASVEVRYWLDRAVRNLRLF